LFKSIEGGEEKDKTFHYLYESCFPLVMRVSYRITGSEAASEDICQEAFIRLYERLDKFKSEDDVKFWLIRVVKNLSLNSEKKRKNEYRLVERIGNENSDASEPSSDISLLKSESVSQVQQALKKLPHNLRTVIVLREYEGFSYRDIAKSLKISESNVKIRAYRARQILQSILGKEGFNVP